MRLLLSRLTACVATPALAATLACTAGTPAPAHVDSRNASGGAEPHAAVAAPPPSSSVVPLASSASPAAADASAAAPSTSAIRDAGGPAEGYFDVYAWAAAHGIRDDDKLGLLGGCRAVTLGEPPREALFCEGGAPDFSVPNGESVFPLLVVDAHDGRLRELLRAPLFAGAMDFPDVVYVRLAASVAPDGRSITIAERAEQTCGAARDAAKKTFVAAVDAPGLRDWLLTIDRACRGRGRYVWRGGKFVR